MEFEGPGDTVETPEGVKVMEAVKSNPPPPPPLSGAAPLICCGPIDRAGVGVREYAPAPPVLRTGVPPLLLAMPIGRFA